ncbi:hypothetical protein [Tunicatimonas pelagia]|uniref:hypothetical protein n=1 Tax=Tunicatimonas pelagia TaxID=931531 RepID=UPI002666E2EE|nr:hypothetical protein [Tunicatimonas pelagia]WKN45107.1 hypothetical protein P0M28_09040 [Tunicatimonas pelagia]
MEKILYILLVIGLIACNPDKKRKVNDAEAKFTTSDASELFFKNVRQGYYDKETMEEAKLDIYRIKERSQAEEQPVLNLAIVINWRYDEAYVLTEPNTYLQQQDTLKIYWQDSVQQTGIYEYLPGNKERHYQFASQVYNSIQDAHQLSTKNAQGERVPVLATRDEREAFRKTMMDYYRLVDLY